jgi:hypothetical protein
MPNRQIDVNFSLISIKFTLLCAIIEPATAVEVKLHRHVAGILSYKQF